jgi:hypothetical protein
LRQLQPLPVRVAMTTRRCPSSSRRRSNEGCPKCIWEELLYNSYIKHRFPSYLHRVMARFSVNTVRGGTPEKQFEIVEGDSRSRRSRSVHYGLLCSKASASMVTERVRRGRCRLLNCTGTRVSERHRLQPETIQNGCDDR